MAVNNHKLRELVDLRILQKIIDDMYRMTGIVGSIFDVDEVLVGTYGNRNACMQYHRQHPESLAHCIASDKALIRQVQQTRKPAIRRCANGLIDAAYPIYIEDTFYGVIMSGQVFNEKPDPAFFRRMAAKYNYDPEPYLEAIGNIPVIPEERFHAAIDFYGQLSGVMSYLSLARLKEMEEKNSLELEVRERTRELRETNEKLKKEIERANRLTREVSESEEKYRALFESSADAIILFELEKLCILDFNGAAARLFGLEKTDISTGKTLTTLIAELSDAPKLLDENPSFSLPLVWYKNKDEAFIPLEITAGSISLHGEKNGFAILRDISETVNNNLKQTQLIQKMQSIFAEVKSFTDFVATDVNLLGPRRFLSDFGITRQEDKVIYYILQGLRNKEIGEKLFLSEETIRKHIHSILRKLKLKNRVELIHMIKNKNIKTTFHENPPV